MIGCYIEATHKSITNDGTSIYDFWACPCCGGKLDLVYTRPDLLKKLDYEEYLHSDWWIVIRALSKKRSRNMCALCSSPEHLNVHHRSYKNLGKEKPEDVIVLCQDCHEKHHGKGNYATA